MNPIDFPEMNLIYGKDQPQYLPLPVKHHKDAEGHVTSCWQLSDEELAEVVRTKQVYVTVMTFNTDLQPHMVTVGVPEL